MKWDISTTLKTVVSRASSGLVQAANAEEVSWGRSHPMALAAMVVCMEVNRQRRHYATLSGGGYTRRSKGEQFMKAKAWIHLLLHVGCVALLLLQGHRIQQLRDSEQRHREKALQVRQLFFACTRTLDDSGVIVDPEFDADYWKIIGPSPNW
jgi:hypothetical protein